MRLTVRRLWRIAPQSGGEEGTVGEMRGDWGFRAYSLEDQVRADPDASTPVNEAKVYGRTAIPAGTYELGLRYSPRSGRDLPHIKSVPGFTEVMIHGANTPVQLQGCVGAGRRRTSTGIADCAGVVDEIVARLRLAAEIGEGSHIVIEDAFEEDARPDPR